MLKYLFALTLLAPIVFCRVAPAERQWKDGDKRQNCTTLCEKVCEPCTEPEYCTDDEIKCGELTIHGHEDCPKSDVCVKKDCICPTDENCPLICEVTCSEEDILCSGGYSNGCKENDYCHKKDRPECPGFCPTDCPDGTNTCPVNDPITGCAVPPICPPKFTDNNGKVCALQQCPILCDHDEQQICKGSIDSQGCPEEDTCIPKCVESCPVQCSASEVKCIGTDNCGTTCVELDTCKEKAKDVNNDVCPDDSYSHECPVECCGDTVLCDPATTLQGCKEKALCYPTSKDNNDDGCPIESDCPKNCLPHEVKCPKTGDDENGCKIPDICITQERDWDGELCTVHCPLECNDETETYCPGQRNEMGCFEPDKCITRAVKTKGSDKGGLCPGWCTPICAHDEVKCPSQVDPCDGCPTEEVCREKVRDKNNEFCSVEPLSASHNCPIFCDDLNGQVLCPAKTKSDGCKEEGVCMDRSTDDNGHWCPAHSVCPANCDADENECPYGNDARGCQSETLCRSRGLDGDDELCPGVCPPTCNKAQTLVAGGKDEKGCETAPSCTEIVYGR